MTGGDRDYGHSGPRHVKKLYAVANFLDTWHLVMIDDRTDVA
jgi:hypothetical protein